MPLGKHDIPSWHNLLLALGFILATGAAIADNDGYFDPTKSHSAGLMKAIQTADATRVRELLESGTNINERKASGETPLTLAVSHGVAEVVEILLEAGADPSIAARRKYQTPSGEPTLPLSIAARESHSGIVTHLIAAGADVNARDIAGTTPLHWAALLGSVDTMQTLLAGGSDVDARTDYGATPLHYAAMGAADEHRRGRSQAGIIGALVAAGADVSARTGPFTSETEKKLGEVKSRARITPHKWHEKLMIAHLECTGKRTPLHLYADYVPTWWSEVYVGNGETVKKSVQPARILVSAGAARFPVDEFGQNPGDYLYKPGATDDLEYFLTGERSDDDNGEAWAVAMSVAAGLAAHEAGLDDGAAARIAGETYETTESSGVGGGLAAATESLNQQLEARRREIMRATAKFQRSGANSNERPADAGVRAHSEAVARSRRFEQCLKSGNSAGACYSATSTSTEIASNTTDQRQAPAISRNTPAQTLSNDGQRANPDSKTDTASPQGEHPTITVNEAIALCWSKTASEWFCAGPTQTLWTSEDTRDIALKRVGCKDFRARADNIAISRSDRGEKWKRGTMGTVFFCGRPLESYDEDPSRTFRFTMPSNPSPRRYRCQKYSTDSEHWDTDECSILRQ